MFYYLFICWIYVINSRIYVKLAKMSIYIQHLNHWMYLQTTKSGRSIHHLPILGELLKYNLDHVNKIRRNFRLILRHILYNMKWLWICVDIAEDLNRKKGNPIPVIFFSRGERWKLHGVFSKKLFHFRSFIYVLDLIKE